MYGRVGGGEGRQENPAKSAAGADPEDAHAAADVSEAEARRVWSVFHWIRLARTALTAVSSEAHFNL